MSTPISGRHVAREWAFLVLFTLDLRRFQDSSEALNSFAESFRDDPEFLESLFNQLSPRQLKHLQHLLSEERHWPFVELLVQGVMDNRQNIDELIQRFSHNWKVLRMNRVDRNILRLAVFELAFEGGTPGPAVLNEAIEIAKRYGTDKSSKFVNGVLDRIAQELERL